MKAKLRVCASCEWIFSEGVTCPKCHFGSYGAHYVYGHKAYYYAKTQRPWKEKKMFKYEMSLNSRIKDNRQNTTTKLTFDMFKSSDNKR